MIPKLVKALNFTLKTNIVCFYTVNVYKQALIAEKIRTVNRLIGLSVLSNLFWSFVDNDIFTKSSHKLIMRRCLIPE